MIRRKINITINRLTKLKKDIYLLTLKMDLLREINASDSEVEGKEFEALKDKFHELRAECLKLTDFAHGYLAEVRGMNVETMDLAQRLQEASEQCRVDYELMNSSFIKIYIKHFKVKTYFSNHLKW